MRCWIIRLNIHHLYHHMMWLNRYKGPLLFLLSQVLFVASHALVKHVSVSVPIPHIMLFRFLFGPIILLPYFLINKSLFKVTNPWLLGVRIGTGVTAMSLLFLAIKLTHIGTVNLLFNCNLIWAFLGAIWIFRERPPLVRYLALPVAFVGILFILNPFLGELDKGFYVALMASIFAAGVILSLKELRKTERSLTIVFYFYTICSILMLPFLTTAFFSQEGETLWLLTLLGLLGLLGQLCMTVSFKYTTATMIANCGFVGIPLMYGVGFLYFGETLSIWGGIGVICVVISLLLTVRYQ